MPTRNRKQIADLKPIEPSCSECGYDLRTLANASGARCPECGAVLPFEKLKFKRRDWRGRRYKLPPYPMPWYRPFWAPSWSMRDRIVVGIVLVLTGMFSGTLTPNSMAPKNFLVLLLVGELVAAHIVIALVNRWELKRYLRTHAELRRKSARARTTHLR